jgi:hypothetical protein
MSSHSEAGWRRYRPSHVPRSVIAPSTQGVAMTEIPATPLLERGLSRLPASGANGAESHSHCVCADGGPPHRQCRARWLRRRASLRVRPAELSKNAACGCRAVQGHGRPFHRCTGAPRRLRHTGHHRRRQGRQSLRSVLRRRAEQGRWPVPGAGESRSRSRSIALGLVDHHISTPEAEPKARPRPRYESGTRIRPVGFSPPRSWS